MVNGRYTRQVRRGGRRAKFAVGLVWLLVAWLGFAAPAGARTVPGMPMSPQDPTQEFFENFQNYTGDKPILLTEYRSATPGIFYTASPYWLQDCNGTILMGNSPVSDGPGASNTTTCATPTGYVGVRRLAWAMGAYTEGCTPAPPPAAGEGGADCPSGVDPGAVHAVTAWTEAGRPTAPPGIGAIQFETCGALPVTGEDFPLANAGPCSNSAGINLAPIALAADHRFITFSVVVAETSCLPTAAGRVRMFFYLRNAAGQEIPLFNPTPPAGTNLPGTPITPCTDPNATQFTTPTFGGTQLPYARVGDYAGDRAYLFSGSSLGIVLRNAETTSGGNDGAYTHIRVLDATPQLDKQFDPAVAERGQPTDLVFTITNTSDQATKQGWSFADTLPAGLVVATPEDTRTTCGPGTTVSAPAGGNHISVTDGNLPASTAGPDGGDPYCQVIVKVTSSVNGTYTNLASDVEVTGLNPPGDATVRFGDADLAIEKTAHPARAVAGRRVLFTLRVHNGGPLDARDVVVSDPMPDGVRLVRAPAGCELIDRTVRCTLGTVAADSGAVVRILVQILPGHHGGLVNIATVSSPTPDPDLGNNRDTVAVPVSRRADLSIVKVAAVRSVVAGGQVQYVLVVHNHGPSQATQVTVTDPLAPQLTATAAVPSQGTCSIAFGVVCRLGSLAVGGSAHILLTANVAETAGGPVANTARVLGAETDPVPGNNIDRARLDVIPIPVPPPTHPPEVTVPQQDVADLHVRKRADRRVAHRGQRVIYTITVSNHGPQDATRVVLRDTPNLAFRLLSVHPTQGRCTTTPIVTCRLGTIRIHAQARVRIVAHAQRAGVAVDSASAAAAQRDPNPHNNLSRSTVRVLHPPKRPPPPRVTG